MLKLRKTVPQAIREAIDSYPGGLCFSAEDGRLILVNRRMNELVSELTGHTVINAGSVWDELGGASAARGCERLESPWSVRGGGGWEQLVFSFPDGRIWRFRRSVLADGARRYVQLEASEVTELYRLSEKLLENNARLKSLRGRQKNLLANIVQINREKELLAAKMRVHGELGRCLIATKKSLHDGTLPEDAACVAKGWEDAIRGLTSIPLDETRGAISPEAELLQVAEMIGCRIDFNGEQPKDRGALLLLYAAVREALTNAVRHAGADRLAVDIRRDGGWYRVRISDNGGAAVNAIREGGGLRNLRARLEREGASLTVECGRGVVLAVDIPAAEGDRND